MDSEAFLKVDVKGAGMCKGVSGGLAETGTKAGVRVVVALRSAGAEVGCEGVGGFSGFVAVEEAADGVPTAAGKSKNPGANTMPWKAMGEGKVFQNRAKTLHED